MAELGPAQPQLVSLLIKICKENLVVYLNAASEAPRVDADGE